MVEKGWEMVENRKIRGWTITKNVAKHAELVPKYRRPNMKTKRSVATAKSRGMTLRVMRIIRSETGLNAFNTINGTVARFRCRCPRDWNG